MRVSSRNFYAVNSTILFDNEIFLLVFFYFNIMKSIVFTVNLIFFLIFYWLPLLKKQVFFICSYRKQHQVPLQALYMMLCGSTL